MSVSSAAAAALDRIASRAADVRNAYRAGAVAVHGDVRSAAAPAPSQNPLDVAAPAGTWFVLDAGDGRRAYGRDGRLTLEGGVLRTHEGRAVLGYPNGEARAAIPQPLRVPAVDAALGRAAGARIGSDGSIAYERAAIDPRSGERRHERVTLGRIALARFPAGTAPVDGDSPAGVTPHLGTPGDGGFAALSPGSRDLGGVDLDRGLERLHDAYLAFSALTAAERARHGVEKTALDLVK